MHAPASTLVTCPDCSAHHKLSEPACPFCLARQASPLQIASRGRSLLDRLGMGLLGAATMVGVSTTMVACYGGGPDFYEPQCDTAADCGKGFQCDTNQQCFPDDIVPCSTDSDCAPDESCEWGVVNDTTSYGRNRCQPRSCSSDVHCESYQLCQYDESTGTSTCVPDPLDCQSDAECEAGLSCLPDANGGARCAVPQVECTGNHLCEYGERCVEGACIEPMPTPQPGCMVDTDCATGEVCAAGQCSVVSEPSACTLDADCAEDARCIDGTCLEPSPTQPRAPGLCVLDRECGPDGACVDGTCHYACLHDSACSRTDVCTEQLCAPAPQGGSECLVGSDCALDALCINGFCASRCDDETAATVCSTGELCDHGVCRPDRRPLPECQVTADCDSGLTCINAQCRAACWADADCPDSAQVCSNGFCFTSHELAPECSRSAECSDGLQCRDGRCE